MIVRWGKVLKGRMSVRWGKVLTGRMSVWWGKVLTGRMSVQWGKVLTGRMSVRWGKVLTGRMSVRWGKVLTGRMSVPLGKVPTGRMSVPWGKVLTGRMSVPLGKVPTGRMSVPWGKVLTAFVDPPYVTGNPQYLPTPLVTHSTLPTSLHSTLPTSLVTHSTLPYVTGNPQYPSHVTGNSQYPSYVTGNPQYPSYVTGNSQYPSYGMAVNGFVNTVISTIEKRYEISSTESGLIASCYDIVFVLLVIPVSYFGGHGHKPRYLGIGILILGIGSFVFALPHFISSAYVVENAEDTVCKLNSNATDQCSTTEGSGLSNYKYFFFLGQGLHGAGATALYTLGVTYMDENVPQRVSSFYNGIFYTGAIIGPAIGYMVGAEFLNVYTEVSVDSTALGLDPSNPKWVGAWWIGFLISGAMGVLLSLPLLAYPSSLPGSKKYAAERGKEAQAMKNEDQTGKSLGIKDCLLSIKLLLTNIPFMFINLAAAADGVLVAGFSTFMPKFIEYQFSVSAATAALYVGLAVVPAGGGATFAGGFIVRFFNLKVRGILRLCTIMSFFLFVLAFSLLMECDTGPFAGVTLQYGQTDVSNATFMGKSLENSCNQGCGCQEEDYFPMCGRDNVMYFSPCYAGCSASKHHGDVKMYYNCSCVSYNITDEDRVKGTTHMGVFGKCEDKCKWLTLFMVLFTFMIVFVFITSMPSLTATLRCVPDHQRSFGLGLQWIVARCLGSIPGPIMFGKMFDLACLVWQKRCDGEGSCFYYDNHNMSINLMILALVFSLIAALTFLIALCFYKVQDESDDQIKIKSEIDLEVFTSDKTKDESLPAVCCNSAEHQLDLKNENHSR
ncbi:Solute carrier organic anion transporter member 4A1 [Bulinus truncatus]|nr:Solute carrier organic anion transporter member 4A1 [Bulinus truncatus]